MTHHNTGKTVNVSFLIYSFQFGLELPFKIDIGSCTYDLQKFFDNLKEAVPNCGLGDFDCKLPMKPGKYEVDDGGFTLPNPIEIPEMLVLVLADWFGNPIKISAKFFGKDGKEIICLDFELQLNLE